MTDRVPDYFEPFVGWRAWRVRDGFLLSHQFDITWPTDVPLEALCLRATYSYPTTRHTAAEIPPVQGCICGIYAATTQEHLLTMPYHKYHARHQTTVVIGEVFLWGRVIVGDKGWKAQYARPKSLLLPHEGYRFYRDLKRRYRVPIELKNTFVL